jgi:hypothetical protein
MDELIQLRDSGPSFYFETVWNLFDVPIYIIFLVFMGLRISTFFTRSLEMSDFAYDVLACNAILLWPRLFAALGNNPCSFEMIHYQAVFNSRVVG